MSGKKLEDRYEIFCRAYVIDFNGKKAAISAGYSPKSAESKASQLLRKVKVKARLAELTKKQASKLEITADSVLREIARLAFFDPGKFFREDGSAIPITELDEDTRRALVGIEIYEDNEKQGDERVVVGHIKKFRFADKGQNLERLGRHLKLFTDRIEHVGLESLAEKLANIRKRKNAG